MRNPILALVVVLALALGAYVVWLVVQRDAGERDVTAGPTAAPGSASVDGHPQPSPDVTEIPEDLVPDPDRIFVGVTTRAGPYDLSEAEAFAEAAGERPQVLLFAQDWANSEFDADLFRAVAARDMLPVLSWEPWDYTEEPVIDERRGDQPRFRLSRILDGEFDPFIERWAQGIAELDFPIGLRFAHEMNGWWYPWAADANENEPEEYVAVWRHVHGIFEEAGADDVIWIWSPNIVYEGSVPLDQLYPGDAYVGWLGVVGYLGYPDEPVDDMETFDEIFGETLDQLRALSDLPIVITEVGASPRGGHKARWIEHFVEQVQRADDIRGFIWFELDKEQDWRIVSSEDAREAFARQLEQPGVGRPEPDEPAAAPSPTGT